jgi:ubiquinone/menaquinone biosynthesis C-methylase UbiE
MQVTPTTVPGLEHVRGSVGLYSEDYGKIQARGVASEFQVILAKKYPNYSDGKRVLELGVGSGSLMPFLRDKFGEKVFGMDISEWIIRNNKIRGGLLAGELQDLPIAPKSVDVIISLHTFEHWPDLERALEEVERILIPGGEATLVVPRPQLKVKQLGALVSTMRKFVGVEKLLETWVASDGDKVSEIWDKLKMAWEKVEEKIDTKLEIAEARTVFVPQEFGSAWIVTLKKVR